MDVERHREEGRRLSSADIVRMAWAWLVARKGTDEKCKQYISRKSETKIPLFCVCVIDGNSKLTIAKETSVI